jgi:ABC-type transport system involved in multi-copper enzyme maturation permease subunit
MMCDKEVKIREPGEKTRGLGVRAFYQGVLNSGVSIMILTIARKEILHNLQSLKFLFVTILMLVTISASLFVMYRDYRLRVENYEILRPGPKEPVAIVPPTPLSIFVRGLDENIGRSYQITFGGQIQVGGKQQSVNTLFRLFTNPDMLFVVKAVISFCALLFAFDMITGEKESRTLGLSLSNSVGRTSVILGKWIGGFASFITPFVLMFLLGIIILQLSPNIAFTSEHMAKLGLIFLSSVLYLSFFFSLGMLISGLTQSSASSLVIALFAWALIVFVMPNLGNAVARQAVRLPSIQQLEMKREHIWIQAVFKAIQAVKKGDKSYSFDQALDSIHGENDKLIQDYRVHFNIMVALSKNLTRLSPSASYTYFVSSIAGTGVQEERSVKDAVVSYRERVWNVPTDSGGNLLGEFPAFSYTRIPLRRILAGEGVADLVILMLFAVLGFAGSYVAFLKYDVR